MSSLTVYLIIAAAVVAGIILVLFLFACISYKIAFGSRYDKNPLLKYFTADDLNLNAQPVSIQRKKHSLNGFIYKKDGVQDNGKLIIFVHGMGSGQIAYTTEIAYFCNAGFTVLALDSTGCNLSGGKNIRGMYEGVNTVKAAVDFARADKNLSGKNIYLVGHSWGAYSALVAATERKVDGVVSLSAPVTPVKTIYFGAAQVIGKPLAAILKPFWFVLELFRFGKRANRNAAKCAQKCDTKVLLIQSANDAIVPLKKSAYYYASGDNIQKYSADDKNHNPYLSVKAQQLVAELFAKLSSASKMSEKERTKYFTNFDFAATCEDDDKVMSDIVKFIN